jgi:hypothetical protein
LAAGHVVEVYADGRNTFRKITGVEKQAGKRATHRSIARPTRYLVRYEGLSAPRTLTPGTTVIVTTESYYEVSKS